MQTGHIIEYGQRASSVLKEKNGDIFAVFSNSVYLQANNTVCCLGTTHLVNGPINIRSDLLKLTGLKAGDPWVHANNALTLGNHYRLFTDNATCKDRSKQNATAKTKQHKLTNSSICIDIIEQILLNHSAHIINNDSDNTANNLVNDQLSRYSSLLTQTLLPSSDTSNEMTIPAELTGIIGCGGGLTPAGDDILVGVLASLHFFNNFRFINLRKWVLYHARNSTNKISLAHLAAACDGQAVELLHDVLETITSTDQLDDYKQALVSTSAMKLANYGHSSGYFALSGVLIVLQTMTID